MIKRAIAGIIYVGLIVGAIMWNQWSFVLLFIIIAALCTNEFYDLTQKAGARPDKIVGIGMVILVFVYFFLHARSILHFDAVSAILILFFIPSLVGLLNQHNHSLLNIMVTAAAIIYIAIPIALFNFFVFDLMGKHYSPVFLLAFFVLQWISDTGAYIIGSLVGKHKLSRKISPNKSWEGLIGGIMLTVIAAYCMSSYTGILYHLHWMIIGLIIAVVGTLGDLFESMIKRSVDVKDSGNILPGHGGVLDRFDSTLFSSSAVYIYLHVFYYS